MILMPSRVTDIKKSTTRTFSVAAKESHAQDLGIFENEPLLGYRERDRDDLNFEAKRNPPHLSLC